MTTTKAWFKNNFENIFLAEKPRSDSGFVYNTGRFILSGITLWKDKSRVVIPSEFLALTGILMLSSIILHHILYYESLNWMNKVIDYGWSSVFLSSTYTILVFKKEIKMLSEEVDQWRKYTYLERETAELKKKSENWVKTFDFYYSWLGYIATGFYNILPAAKFFYNGPKQRMDALIYPSWTPLSLDTTWGFFATYIWEVFTMVFAYLTYSQLFLFLITFTIAISHQLRLVGIVFTTIEDRIDKMMKDKICVDKEDWYSERTLLLHEEINNGVMHFQRLRRYSAELFRIFSSMTNVTYHGGMWVMCSVGVKAATDMSFVIMLQAFMMIAIVIVSQYAFSFISECLIEEMEKVRNSVYDCPWYKMPVKCQKTFHIFHTMLYPDRFPTLRTIMGTKTNMENLSKVINASYCYFSMIITMKAS